MKSHASWVMVIQGYHPVNRHEWKHYLLATSLVDMRTGGIVNGNGECCTYSNAETPVPEPVVKWVCNPLVLSFIPYIVLCGV